MALTNVTFNYNVAKIIDTPWNTIINGLNYTKTNLAPLALKYTLCNNIVFIIEQTNGLQGNDIAKRYCAAASPSRA